MGSVRVFFKPNRTEPKNSQTEPDRTERLFKKFEPNRIEPKNSQTEPNRTDFALKLPKIIPFCAGIRHKLPRYVPTPKSTQNTWIWSFGFRNLGFRLVLYLDFGQFWFLIVLDFGFRILVLGFSEPCDIVLS
jgi:hypothetical protein